MIIIVEDVSKNIIYRIIDNFLAFNTHIVSFLIKKKRLFIIFLKVKIALKVFIESKS